MIEEILLDERNKQYHLEYGGKAWNKLADELLVDIGRNIGKSEQLGREIREQQNITLGIHQIADQTGLRTQRDNSLRDVPKRNVSQLRPSKKAQIHNG